MKSKKAPLICLAVFMLVALAGCPIEIGNQTPPELPPYIPDWGTPHPPWGNPPFTGVVTGTASGNHGHGIATVVIHLTLLNGIITEVNLDDSSGHTPGAASAQMALAPAQIIGRNNAHVDIIATATITAGLIMIAGEQALARTAFRACDCGPSGAAAALSAIAPMAASCCHCGTPGEIIPMNAAGNIAATCLCGNQSAD